MVSQISTSVNPNNKVYAKMSAEDIKKVPDKIEETGKTINDSLDKINDTMKRTTESVGGIAITGAGLLATFKKMLNPVLDLLKKPKIDSATGKEILDSAGKVVKQFSKNRVIGAAIAATAIAAFVIIRKVCKNKAKKAEEAQIAQQTQPAEQIKPEEKKLDVVVS